MKKHAAGHWSFNTRDLMRSSGCEHCSQLAIARELGVAGIAQLVEEHSEEATGLALTYGKLFEAALEQELLEHLGKDGFKAPEDAHSQDQTIALMKEGVPVIYQG